MDSERKSIAKQILEAIEYGNISESEVERRLDRILDEELNVSIHTKVDMTKVNLCNSLLWQLYTHGRIAYENHIETSKKVVERQYTKRKRKRKIVYGGLRVFALSLIFFVFLSAFDSVRWFKKSSTEDEQQLIVSYHEVDGLSIAKAIEAHNTLEEFTSNSADEVEIYLGFKYDFPEKIGASYYPYNYHVLVMPELISIVCIYKNEAQEHMEITLQAELFANIEGTMIQHEQDAEGKSIMIGNTTVYKYNNVGKIRYVWEKSNQVFKLSINSSAELSNQDVQDIIEWGCGH